MPATEVALTKSRSVHTLEHAQPPNEETGGLGFASFDGRFRPHLRYADWQDMGEPDTITVTVVPGDTLNQ